VKNDGTCCIADLGLAISRPKPGSKELEELDTKVISTEITSYFLCIAVGYIKKNPAALHAFVSRVPINGTCMSLLIRGHAILLDIRRPDRSGNF
jgi:hypothetical protein